MRLRRTLLGLLLFSMFGSLVFAQSISVSFIDELGSQVTQVLENGRARLRVVDPGGNAGAGLDAVTVAVTTALSGSSTPVTLTETGTDTGVFEGDVGLTTALASSEDVSTVPFFWSETRDTAIASYNGATGSAEVAAALIDFLVDGQKVPHLAAGESFTLRISDFAANQSASGRESLQATVTSNGDSLTLELLETGLSTSIFEGTVRTAFWNVSGPEDLGVGATENLQVTHASSGDQLSATLQVLEGAVRFVDAQGRVAPVVLDNDRAFVRVIDRFLNTDPLVRESLTVAATALRSGDTETLTVTETRPDSGIFEGSLRVASSLGTYAGNGMLETQPLAPDDPDTIAASYTSSSLRLLTTAAAVAGSQTELLDAAGNPAKSFAFGETIRVRVRSYFQGGQQMTIRSIPTGDVKDVELLLVDPERFVYEGSIVMRQGGPYPSGSFLTAHAGDTIAAEFPDTNGITRSQATALAAPAAVRFVDEEGQPTPFLLDGGLARLQVWDEWLTGTMQLAVNLSDRFSGDQETALLDRTRPGSYPLFAGSMQLAIDYTPAQNGLLTTYRSFQTPTYPDVVTATYETQLFGPVRARAQTLPARLSFLDEQGEETVTLPAGAPLRLRLHYPALELRDAEIDQIPLNLAAATSGDFEQILLTETGNDTRIFETSFTPEIGGQSLADGTLQIQASDSVTAEYSIAPWHRLRAAARLLPLVLDFADAQGTPVDSYAIHERIHVRAHDVLGNVSPANPDLISVEIQAHRPTDGASDLETVSLLETGPDTGAFTGWIDMRQSYSAVNQDGLLQLSIYGPPYLELQSLEVRRNGVSARARLRDSTTRIVTAQGDETGTVVIEHPIHIRVIRPLSNTSSGQDQLYVNVHNRGSGDDEQVLLQETGDSTGVFEGSIGTAPGDSAQHYNGTVQALPEDLVEVRVAGSSTPSLDFVRVINNPPQAEDDTATTLRDTPVVIPVLSNDSDPDGHQIHVDGGLLVTEAGVQVTHNPDGTLSYTPPAGFTGTDRFSYFTYDPYGSSDSALVEITVEQGDLSPIAEDDFATTTEDAAVTIFILSNDMDPSGGFPILTDVSPATSGSVVINGDSSFTYTPGPDFFGTDSLTYTIADGDGDLDTATVSITVTSVNDAPNAVNDFISVVEDTPITFEARGNDSDPEGDPLTLASTVNPAFGTLALHPDGTLTYTPALNYNGLISFTYTITDGNGGADSATVTINVTGVNDAPNAMNDSASTPEDTAVGVNVLANDTDPEAHSLTVSAVTQGAHGSVAIVLGSSVTYTPAPNYFGPDSFTYTASDGNGGSKTATVSINVTAVNDGPDAVNDTASTPEDTPVTIDVRGNDSDPEDNPLSLYLVSQGAHGSVAIASGTVTYTPAANFNGADSFTYTITDGNGAFDTATVSINVTAANDAPDAVNDTALTNEDTAATINVLGNDSDVDGEVPSVIAVTQGSLGSATVNGNGSLTYLPNPNAFGSDLITYTIRDAAGATDTASVSVTIQPVNDLPDAVNDTAATREGASVLIVVLANDTDLEGQALSVLSYSTPPNGALSRQSGDSLRYVPNPNFNGVDSFTYTVSDGNGGTDTATVTVTVSHSLERLAVLATNSVWLQSGSDVLSGDVVVNADAAGPFLNGGVELSLAGTATTPSGWDVLADQVTLAAGAVVNSDLFYNLLTNGGTVNGAQSTPVALPVFPTLPAFPTAAPGSTDVNVGTNGTRTLAAGSYRDLIVGRKGVVTFTGGVYHFRSIRIDREAKIWFSAATQVRVQQKLSTKQTTTLAPAAGASIDAADIILYVAGINGTGGGLTETPKAVEIGTDNQLHLNVYAPNGTLWLGDRTQGRGSFFARDVQVGIDAQVELRTFHRNQ